MQRTIELPEEQVQELERVAANEQRSLDQVVQFAVSDYLARRQSRSEWGRRLEEAVERIRADIPPDITPDEIEADVTAAWQEYRAERAAKRTAAGGPGAGGR